MATLTTPDVDILTASITNNYQFVRYFLFYYFSTHLITTELSQKNKTRPMRKYFVNKCVSLRTTRCYSSSSNSL